MEHFKTLTEKGILKFPKFVTPDSFDNASNKFLEDWENGEFGTILEMDSKNPETTKLIEKLQEIRREKLQELKASEKYDPEMEIVELDLPVASGKNKEGNYNGKTEFKFKRKARNKKGEEARIIFVDGKKQFISKEELALIATGSEAKINFMVYSYDIQRTDRNKKKYVEFGISLCMLAVQILKAVKKGENLDCFDVVEDGYDSLSKEEYLEIPCGESDAT